MIKLVHAASYTLQFRSDVIADILMEALRDRINCNSIGVGRF
jgi:hypothetical protein